MNGILVIAHAPLASALRQCVLHVFPDAAATVVALDVQPNVPPEESLQQARLMVEHMGADTVLMLTDVFGATPCNVAQRLLDRGGARLIAGVSLPMLLRAVTYRHETLDMLVSRAMAGGTQGIIPVNVTAPQNQNRRSHDQDHHDHQQ
ncbi:MAG: PTS fructose transporter subunit IIA [Polaromonas sp.]|nr:PTS fructose transporter subunit IIA [Polaromonas sp.]